MGRVGIMKTLNITFTDGEHARLIKAKRISEKKNAMSWHDYIIRCCCKGVSLKI